MSVQLILKASVPSAVPQLPLSEVVDHVQLVMETASAGAGVVRTTRVILEPDVESGPQVSVVAPAAPPTESVSVTVSPEAAVPATQG